MHDDNQPCDTSSRPDFLIVHTNRVSVYIFAKRLAVAL